MADLDVVDQYEVIHKAGFALFLGILVLRHASELDMESYVDVEHPVLSYDFATGYVSSLSPSRVAKRQHLGPQALLLISTDRDILWLPGLVYASIQSFRSD